jgi:hypothetical protein
MNEPSTAESMSHARLRRLTVTSLAMWPRLAYTMLLLGGVGVSGVVLALLISEPALPVATRLAFGLIAGLGLGWAVFAAWVLTRRRVLLAWHRVVAARMAVGCCAVFAATPLAVAALTSMHSRALRALWVAVPMLALSWVQLVRAHRRHDSLVRRRQELADLVEADRLIDREAGTIPAHGPAEGRMP